MGPSDSKIDPVILPVKAGHELVSALPPGRLVRFAGEPLLPRQQPTRLKLTKQTDYYEQRCVKYPGRGCFHCYAEFIHALLLEADAAVNSFVPQPFHLIVKRRPYIPDVYLVRDGHMSVLELKPEAKFDRGKEALLQAFFHEYGVSFNYLANETVLEQELLALHWLPLVQVLAQAQTQGLDTWQEEQRLLEAARAKTSIAVGDLLDNTSRQNRYWLELGLYRLLHRHELECDLRECPLDYETEVTAWT